MFWFESFLLFLAIRIVNNSGFEKTIRIISESLYFEKKLIRIPILFEWFRINSESFDSNPNLWLFFMIFLATQNWQVKNLYCQIAFFYCPIFVFYCPQFTAHFKLPILIKYCPIKLFTAHLYLNTAHFIPPKWK